MKKSETGITRTALHKQIAAMLEENKLRRRYNRATGKEELQVVVTTPDTPEHTQLKEDLGGTFEPA